MITLIANLLKNPTFKNYIWTIILIILLLIPNIYLTFYGEYFYNTSHIKKILYVLLSFILISAPLTVIKPKFYFILSFLLFIFVPLEIFIIKHYHCTITPGILYSILNTNKNEAKEVLFSLKMYLSISLISYIIYIRICIKQISNNFKIPIIKKVILGIIIFITLLSVYLNELKLVYLISPSKNIKEIIITGNQNFTLKFNKIFPFNYITTINAYIETKRIIKQYKNSSCNFKFNAHREITIENPEIYILIIGESSRRKNYQLYNYSKKTTPLLNNQQNLIVYSDCISTGNLTSFCIPMIITRATPLDFLKSYKEKSFIEAFKNVGFKTYWLSNQALFNSDHARLTYESDFIYDLNGDISRQNNFDEKILPYLDTILNKKENKKLIIINLMGSHFKYNLRYPSNFELFKPCLSLNFGYDQLQKDNREYLINMYDNSILYTDFIINSIINKVKNTSAVSFIMYLSDHGENIFDDNKNYSCHGGNIPTNYEVEIPFFMWYSNIYYEKFPLKIKNLINNKNKKVSSNNIFYSIIDIADIKTDKNNLDKSISSNLFKEDSLRYIISPSNNIFIYDKSIITKKH
jgi:glucan phosphoethanolaminetransferase (alkaline phosphatase superfamily)